jgi:hypothetical protein
MNTDVGGSGLAAGDGGDEGDFVGGGEEGVEEKEVVVAGEAGAGAEGGEVGVALDELIPKGRGGEGRGGGNLFLGEAGYAAGMGEIEDAHLFGKECEKEVCHLLSDKLDW